MEVTRCERGHYYDKALGKCPICAAEASANFNRQNLFGPTVTEDELTVDMKEKREKQPEVNTEEELDPVTELDLDLDLPELEPLAGLVMEPPEDEPVFPEEEPDFPKATGDSTLPERMLAGWLVCVAGPEKGKSYCLYTGGNCVGRSEKMDVRIMADSTVSRENHAFVSYDVRERRFYAMRGETRNITYVNGKALRREVELNSRDILEIGSSKFMLVPFCGPEFDWRDADRFCHA